MGTASIQATDQVGDIDAAWLKVEAYLAERGIHMTPNDDPTDPVFWAQVDALQQHDPEISRLLMALTIVTTRGQSVGCNLNNAKSELFGKTLCQGGPAPNVSGNCRK